MATISEQYNEVTLSLQSSRNTIRNKLIELGLAVSSDTLDKLATAIEGIINQGAVSIQVKEGETVTIPAGFHNGGGTVAGVAGGGNYTLQSKTVTPNKKQQSITSDAGYYGLDSVIINAIPDAYQDVSGVTAIEEDVLVGKIIVLPSGATAAGSMPDNGAVNQILDATTLTYTIPKGKHSGTGTVKIVAETKTVTPSKSEQNVTPTAGKVLTKVIVGAIPDQYQDVTPVTATAPHVLDGDIIVDSTGNQVEGTMPNNGAQNLSINPLTQNSVSIPAGYTSGGTLTVTEDLLNALKAI